MRRKEERSQQGQTNNKAKQHSTPKAVSFPKKNELPRVGLEATTLRTKCSYKCNCTCNYTCECSHSRFEAEPSWNFQKTTEQV